MQQQIVATSPSRKLKCSLVLSARKKDPQMGEDLGKQRSGAYFCVACIAFTISNLQL